MQNGKEKKTKVNFNGLNEAVNKEKDFLNELSEKMGKTLQEKCPQCRPEDINALIGRFKDEIDEELSEAELEYTSEMSEIVSEKEIVMEINDLDENLSYHSNLDSYEREYRRVKELLKHDDIVKKMLDRGIRRKDKDAYVRFIKKIYNNPEYKKYLKKAKKARAGEKIAISNEMLIELLDLLENMAETKEEKNLVNMRRVYFEQIKEISSLYSHTIEMLNGFSYFDLADKIYTTKDYISKLKGLNNSLENELKVIKENKNKKKEIASEIINSLY